MEFRRVLFRSCFLPQLLPRQEYSLALLATPAVFFLYPQNTQQELWRFPLPHGECQEPQENEKGGCALPAVWQIQDSRWTSPQNALRELSLPPAIQRDLRRLQ